MVGLGIVLGGVAGFGIDVGALPGHHLVYQLALEQLQGLHGDVVLHGGVLLGGVQHGPRGGVGLHGGMFLAFSSSLVSMAMLAFTSESWALASYGGVLALSSLSCWAQQLDLYTALAPFLLV